MTYDACSCDYDMPEFCDVMTRKARKVHKCYECRGTINPGDSYERTAGKWDGEFTEFKTCELCAELRQWARISVPCFCWTYGDLHEHVRSMVEEVRSDVPAGFVFEWGRRMIKIERRRFGEYWPRKFQNNRPPRPAAQIVRDFQP